MALWAIEPLTPLVSQPPHVLGQAVRHPPPRSILQTPGVTKTKDEPRTDLFSN